MVTVHDSEFKFTYLGPVQTPSFFKLRSAQIRHENPASVDLDAELLKLAELNSLDAKQIEMSAVFR